MDKALLEQCRGLPWGKGLGMTSKLAVEGDPAPISAQEAIPPLPESRGLLDVIREARVAQEQAARNTGGKPGSARAPPESVAAPSLSEEHADASGDTAGTGMSQGKQEEPADFRS